MRYFLLWVCQKWLKATALSDRKTHCVTPYLCLSRLPWDSQASQMMFVCHLDSHSHISLYIPQSDPISHPSWLLRPFHSTLGNSWVCHEWNSQYSQALWEHCCSRKRTLPWGHWLPCSLSCGGRFFPSLSTYHWRWGYVSFLLLTTPSRSLFLTPKEASSFRPTTH